MRIGRAVIAGIVLALAGACVAQAATPTLSVTDRLKDRRYVAAGTRAYAVGFEDGRWYGQGWHVTGEMGGIWTQPLKLVDGVWFSVDGQWVGPATRFTSGWGYVRMELPQTAGLNLTQTEFAPDGVRGFLIGLRLENPGATKTVSVAVDAHSELLYHYPWAWTTPDSTTFNLQDTGSYDDGALVFRETGTPPAANATAHDWAAILKGTASPVDYALGPDHRGPQDTPVVCGGDPPPQFCDDGPSGKGTGGQLRYELTVPGDGAQTLWVAVAGSDQGLAAARNELATALRDPAGELADKVASREAASRRTQLSLPGDPLLADAVDWGKQNLLDLTAVATGLRIRDVDEGRAYPPPLGTVPRIHWIGAGFPDYPWLFATDGEYTAFASVAVGQFEAIEDHARALRDVSLVLNGNSGKLAHEVVSEGSVYFGANDDPGNTDETAKFPSMVALIWRWTGDNGFRDEMYSYAKSNLEWIFRQEDADGDGWPEGLGNVERSGMGEEKLDNTVYTIRALYDLADMAQSKNDGRTLGWALGKANQLRDRFEGAWWMPAVEQYADSLDDPGDVQVQQKHWIGVTPMEAELTTNAGAEPGLAVYDHGTAALGVRETSCYTGTFGLYHTGCGGGPEGTGELVVFTLGNAVMAVGEGNYGRLGAGQQRYYTDANRATMFLPDEQPGAMPEIAPSPDFGRNIDRCTICRSMVMQAWGNYGTAWPVVHQQLGVRPDLGRARLEVVPQVPGSEPIAGANIRLGNGAVDVLASRDGATYRTTVDTGQTLLNRLLIGHTLPRGAAVVSVTLDGVPAAYDTRLTNRGLEVTVSTRPGAHTLVVTTA